MKNQNGFSLIEIIVVILLIGVIAAASAKLLISGGNAYVTSSNVINASWQGQVALERMVRDIRAVRSPSDITTASASQFVFVDSSGTTNTYTLSGSSLTLNGNTLADGINSLTFNYYDASGTTTATLANIRLIQITLNITQGGANFSLTTTAYPRNLQ